MKNQLPCGDPFAMAQAAQVMPDPYGQILKYAQQNQPQPPPPKKPELQTIIDELEQMHQLAVTILNRVLGVADRVLGEQPESPDSGAKIGPPSSGTLGSMQARMWLLRGTLEAMELQLSRLERL